jgi:acyl-CoA thioesterase
VVVADSTGALRVDEPDGPPTLWFPWADVRGDVLTGGPAHFDLPGPAPARTGPVTWGDDGEVPADGVAAVRRDGDLASFDARRVRVELVEEGDGVDGDVSPTRFPNWGDAADLVTVLEGGQVPADAHRPVVEGSQLLGQAVVAAMRHVPGRRVVSAHMAFLKAADATRPVAVDLEPLSAGRTFTALAARATQGDRLVAAGTLLLGVPAADVVRHQPPSDPATGPSGAVPHDMGVTGRDLRVVDAAYTDDPAAAVGPPHIDAWVRFRRLPDDPAVHAGLLAQFTGHMSIAAALRPHAGVGQREAHRTLSTAINAIAISFHAEPRMDDWVLYRHHATVVADGMAHSECRVHDAAGELLASFTVDAMLRPLDRPSPDARTAL